MTVIDDTVTDRATTDHVVDGNRVIGHACCARRTLSCSPVRAVFTNDMKVPGALHLAVLRSPYAHARITSIDASRRGRDAGRARRVHRRRPRRAWAAPMPCAWPVTDDMKNPTHYPLAVHTVALRR